MKKLLLIIMMSASCNIHAMDRHHQGSVNDECEHCIKVGPVNWGALTSNMAAIQQGSELQELPKKEDEESSESTNDSWTEEDLKFYRIANEWHEEALKQKCGIEQAKQLIEEGRRMQQENSSVHSGETKYSKKESEPLALAIVTKKSLPKIDQQDNSSHVKAKPQLHLTNQPDPEDWHLTDKNEDDDKWVEIIKDNTDDDKEKK